MIRVYNRQGLWKHDPDVSGHHVAIEKPSIRMIGYCTDVLVVQEIQDSITKNINNNIMELNQIVNCVDVVMSNEQSRARREATRQYYRELYESKSWTNTGFKYFIFLGFLGMLFFSDMFQLLWMDDDIQLVDWKGGFACEELEPPQEDESV
jgi:hypothetical protein